MADCKRKTANLFDWNLLVDGYHLSPQTGLPISHATRIASLQPVKISTTGAYLSFTKIGNENIQAMYSVLTDDDTLIRRVISIDSGGYLDLSGGSKLYIAFYDSSPSSASTVTKANVSNIMLNTGSTALPYEPYGWVHSLRKLTTATDMLTTLPADIYADGNDATVVLKGNTVQSGTPTPDNPIMPQGTGERTGNLTESYISNCNINSSGKLVVQSDFNMFLAKVKQGKMYIIDSNFVGGFFTTKPTMSSVSYNSGREVTNQDYFTAPIDGYVAFRKASTETTAMMNEGNELLPYEPYGYKIPISSASTTTPVYLGEVETTRKIRKLVLTGKEDWHKSNTYIGSFYAYLSKVLPDAMPYQFPFCSHLGRDSGTYSYGNCRIDYNAFSLWAFDTVTSADDFKSWLAQQYANGTPVTVWYILASETTGIVNEPLMKIGNYADEVSNVSIPVTAGGDTLSVDTTVQPSEVTVSYTGWHDATVKEWDGSQWNE